jgi:ABC-2 type transport system ATP-binding protein
MFLVTEEFDLPPIRLSEFADLNRPFYPKFSDEVLDSCLKDFELDRHVKLNELSMGQRKKAFMSFALATNTKYLFMDEPTNGLDIPSKSLFRKVVAQNMTEDSTLIISTHQVHDIESLLDHIVILDNSQILVDSSVADITDKYCFRYRNPQDMEGVLYAEPSLQGNAAITLREADEDETTINLELFFNAATKGMLK